MSGYDKIDNGLEPLWVLSGLEMLPRLRVSRILKWLEREGMRISRDKSQKRHVRIIAREAAMHAADVRNRFRRLIDMRKKKKIIGPPKALYQLLHDLTFDAFTAGFYFNRLSLESAEPDANAGMKSRLAARGPRKPRAESVRDRLITLPNWKTTTNAALLRKLQHFFPKSTTVNLKRQIQRTKKSGH